MRGRALFVIALLAAPPAFAQDVPVEGDPNAAPVETLPTTRGPAESAPTEGVTAESAGDAAPPPSPPTPAAPGHASSARAGRPVVAAVLEPCVPVDAEAFHRVLSLELGRDVDYLAGDAGAPGATRVHVDCVDDGVELRLEDPVTRKSMARVLSLETLPDRSRTRLLALAAAEFVVASWIELSIRGAPSVEPVAPPPSEEDQRAVAEIVRVRHAPPAPKPAPPAKATPPAEPRDGWQVAAAATGQRWSSQDALLLGGALRLLRHAPGALAWTFAADAATARPSTPEGPIALTSFGLSGALLLHLRGRGGAVLAGPGARVGLVRLAGQGDGESFDGVSFVAPLVGPIGYGRAEVVIFGPVRAALDLELGLATMPTRAKAGDETILELDGVWFTGALGLGAVF